ncbi:hypothetical protein GOP47_0012255 [Adiantum capillus-veneris]|uniref:Roadblock/LAMTOR2 domain-containing protein n=1 Tax=Adiantum capillus-veneris TaxID=13818 RepID=A0A9D4UQU5_ADICA|nr:hypothetical protein GOP47_0012255 [Adiantum capillus-veneris]
MSLCLPISLEPITDAPAGRLSKQIAIATGLRFEKRFCQHELMEDPDEAQREADRLLASAKLFKRKYEVEETFKRVGSHKGVLGTMIMSSMGIPIKSTMDAPTTMKHAVFLGPLAAKAKHMLHSIDASQELTLLRARSIDREVIIVPKDDFVVIILQKVSNK